MKHLFTSSLHSFLRRLPASDIFVATVAIASVAQIAWVLARRKKVSGCSGRASVIVVFGGATLLLRDETIMEADGPLWLAGVVFLGGLAFRHNLVKAVMSEAELVLPEPVWTKLCIAWGVFFLFKGTLNLWVAYTFSTPIWVKFKVFGGMGLMVAFVVAQALWLAKYLPEEPAEPAPPKPTPAKSEGS